MVKILAYIRKAEWGVHKRWYGEHLVLSWRTLNPFPSNMEGWRMYHYVNFMRKHTANIYLRVETMLYDGRVDAPSQCKRWLLCLEMIDVWNCEPWNGSVTTLSKNDGIVKVLSSPDAKWMQLSHLIEGWILCTFWGKGSVFPSSDGRGQLHFMCQ